LEAIIVLFQRSVCEVASHDYSPAQVAAGAPAGADLCAWSKRLADGGVFVCTRKEQIVGFARIDSEGCVDLLYVDPDYQRQGVGRELMAQVFSWAANRGLPGLHSEVSVTARPFFEHMGFRVVRPQVVERRGVRFENFVMECSQ
jgi:putative acetyltransferase